MRHHLARVLGAVFVSLSSGALLLGCFRDGGLGTTSATGTASSGSSSSSSGASTTGGSTGGATTADPTTAGTTTTGAGTTTGADQTSSGGSTGAPDLCAPAPADDPCSMCLKQECCDQIYACDADPGCTCFLDCLALMITQDMCLVKCEVDPQQGPLGDYVVCALGVCQMQCM